MAGHHPYRHCGALFFAASLCVLCTLCIARLVSGSEAGPSAQTCEENHDIQLEISGKSPVAKFKCGQKLTHFYPTVNESLPATSCFTEVTCSKKGTLPDGAQITVDNQKVYTAETTKIPSADATAYFLCTDQEQLSAREVAKKCTVEVKIKGSPSISEDRQCTKAGDTVNVRLTAPTNEATFACGGDLTTLDPSVSTEVFSDESCTTRTKLGTLIPEATLTSGTALEERRHTLTVLTFPEKTTTLCYKCQKKSAAEACKVIIKVDGTSTTTTTSSTSGARRVMAEAGGHITLWVAALCTGVLYGR